MKFLILFFTLCAVTASAQPLSSLVTFQNATTNVVVVNGSDYFGNAFTLDLSPGQAIKQLFTRASFNTGAWMQAQPTDGTDMQVLIARPVTDVGPTFLIAFSPPLIPSSSALIEYWIWGLCTAIALGLAGSMRRMLGRVHEVNTDL